MAGPIPVALPGGLLDGNGALHGSAWLEPLRGWDEEFVHWLDPDLPVARAVTGILARVVRRVGPHRANKELVRELPVGDRDYLMLAVRIATFGSRVETLLACPQCGAWMDIDFDLGSVPIEPRPQQSAYLLEACAGLQEASFRLPRGADQEEVLGESDPVSALLARCLVSVDGRTDAGSIAAAARREDLRARIDDAMERVSPKVEATWEGNCPECGQAFSRAFDPAAFLLEEIAQRRAAFDGGVHLLSFHYHWPPGDILRLTPKRRDHYLALLRKELDRTWTGPAGMV